MEKITMLDVSLPVGELWLDTGIIFPFFNKLVRTNYVRWVDALIEISKQSTFFTTKPVKDEVVQIFNRWHPDTRKAASGCYRRFFNNFITVKDISAHREGGLSGTDVSLLKRPKGILITADRLLYESDTSSAVYVSLKEIDLGYCHQLNIQTKNLQNESRT